MSNDANENEVSQFIEEGDKKRLHEFLVRLVDAPAKNIIGLADDWLKYFRYKNLLHIYDKVKALHEERSLQGKLNPLPPKYAIPLLETSSLEDVPKLQDLWARLIANATDPEFEEDYHPSYVEILKQLSSDEALLIEALTRVESYPVLFNKKTRTRSDWISGGDSPVLESYNE